MGDLENRYQLREMLSFQMAFNKSSMLATWCLSVVIVGLFFIEEFLGGSDNISVLIRMGANVSDLVKKGEYYRMLSSVFLHAGYLHVFFNTYVLYVLGGFFNKILGQSRFLCIFFFSGFTGSLASILLGKSHISVGASGAIWGLFGASLVLALFKTSYLPEAIRLRLRRLTAINLIINLGVSFLPMVDFWAHIGGGLGGFLISLFIVFEPHNALLLNIKNIFLRILALLFILIYIGGFIIGLYQYRPWQLKLPTSFHTKVLKEVPFTISIPEGIKEYESKSVTENINTFTFGDIRLNEMVIEFFFFKEKEHLLSENWLRSQYELFLTDEDFEGISKKSLKLTNSKHGLILSYEKPASKSHKVITNLMIKQNYIVRCSLIISNKVDEKNLNFLLDNLLDGINFNK